MADTKCLTCGEPGMRCFCFPDSEPRTGRYTPPPEETNASKAAAAKMEPEIAALEFLPSLGEAATVSIAISLKRIADVLSDDGLGTLLNKIAFPPANAYGEGFSEAIQNSIARGLNGIEVPR